MLDLLSKRFHSRSFHDTENPKVVWKIVLNEQYLSISIRIVFLVNLTVPCTKLLVSITTSKFNQNQRSISFNHCYHQCGKYCIFFMVHQIYVILIEIIKRGISLSYLNIKDIKETATTNRSNKLKPALQNAPGCRMNP